MALIIIIITIIISSSNYFRWHRKEFKVINLNSLM